MVTGEQHSIAYVKVTKRDLRSLHHEKKMKSM